MPKATSKTSKKKKYNARFPPARIKKIMQTDEEVGKVAAAVPVIISRALEMFIESLILKTAKTTQDKNAKTLSSSHIKQTIHSEKQFDFLRDLVKNVPDYQTDDNNGDVVPDCLEQSTKKGRRGRPKMSTNTRKSAGKEKSGQAKTFSDSSEEEDYDIDEEDENTDTDEELTNKPSSASMVSHKRIPPVQPMSEARNGADAFQPGFSGDAPPAMPPLPTPSQSQDRGVSTFAQYPPYLPHGGQGGPLSMPPFYPSINPQAPPQLMPPFPVPVPQGVSHQQQQQQSSSLPINLSSSSTAYPQPSGLMGSKADDYDS